MPAATRTKATDMTAAEATAMLKGAPKPARMDGPAILAELELIAPPLDAFEAVVDKLRARRLELWCAARLLSKEDGGRPIFMALAEASSRSEALVIKATKREFEKRGIEAPR
jgi:phosphatidylserine/phosphatidylglycerophosphate/cardiolipin synthase-like enzyme